MNKRSISPLIKVRTRVLLLLVVAILFTSVTGCVIEQPNNEMSATTNPVSITYTYCHSYNGTSYLTGIVKNMGSWNLLNIGLQAEGYANNTTRERGYAGPQTGVNSTLLPGESTPFMITMSQTTSDINTTNDQIHITSASSKLATSTRNITSNRSITQVSTQTVKKCDLLYKIMPPEYKLAKTEPNLLTITNNKTRFSNQTISVSGEVYNGGNKNVTAYLVAVAFYRNDGYVLGVFVSKPQGELGPKQTAQFQIDIPSHFFDSSISSVNATKIEEYAYELTS
jgi:hypothetical protein